MGGLIAYVSADGKYLLSGNVYDLDTQENLTAARRNAARAKALAAASRKPDDRLRAAEREDDRHGVHGHRLRLLPQVPQPDRRHQQGGRARALHDVSAHGPGHRVVDQGGDRSGARRTGATR